ncbi:MAG TPA: LysR family transcriptional regulator [Ideonella sp.]|uniref:LysR family transcriptional regulator n=1 Tax=Ideonella sp. TaxID=1929293 RepID=UPI002E328D76|nr:LysR family transcriptional regulator [Ideonella sp.]HEX5684434.1 LysR family transcriptional regulator [Ideonella sp.]
MRITHRHVDIFRALMNAGGVTAAAQALNTSQPTVSRELARLEQLLGLRLFDRVRGRLHPTAQAFALYEEVQRSYLGLERIAATATQLRQFAQGQLSVVCLPALSHGLLSGACTRFLARHPGVGLTITQQESPYLEEWLATQRCDLGLTESEATPAGTAQQLLIEMNEVAVLPAGHALAAKRRLKPSDFDGQAFVSLAPGDPYRHIIDSLFEQHGVQRHQAIETHSAVSVCAMVKHGLGLGIVNPLTAMEQAGPKLVLRPLTVAIPFRVNLVRPLHRPANPLVDRLVEALQEEAAALRRAGGRPSASPDAPAPPA